MKNIKNYEKFLNEDNTGEVVENIKVSKNITYSELEEIIKQTLDKNDFDAFNDIITDLYNYDLDKLFFRLFVNYDYFGKKLTKALFNSMK